VTSVQLIGQQGEDIAEVSYQQESIERQIDHFYHLAYPIMPVGTIIDFGGFLTPEHYLLCDGAAISRTDYSLLFSALTTTETVSLTSTVNTFTVVAVAPYHIGMAIEGVGIPAATTISNISGATITMSAAATMTVASSVRFFAWGAGNGTTTFNTPNLQGYTTAGANGTLYPAVVNGVGLQGGAASHAITISEMPAHRHDTTPSTARSNSGSPGGSAALYGSSSSPNQNLPIDVSTQGGGVAMSLIQPTALVKKFIRFE
jgi:microcystin-dependent protein